MRLFVTTILTALVAGAASKSVDSYIGSEKPIAKAGLLANIGAQGTRVPGALVRLHFILSK
jgi:glucoamylase